MEAADLDRVIDRRCSDSVKWGAYANGVLPLWVADMDFPAPEPVLDALHRRVEHGVFGYARHPSALSETIADRLEKLYHWRVSPEAVSFLPGVVSGFNLAARALARPQGELLIQTPVYPPFLSTAGNAGMQQRENLLVRRSDAYYEIDFREFSRALNGRTAAFLLCNPHNPVGRVFRREELEGMAAACLRAEVPIISDEIHGDLVFRDYSHIPLASLSPELERKTITLMAPSKTFNIPGLECAFAVVPDDGLRERFKSARSGLVPEANLLGCEAALAAYRHGQPWLDTVLDYLEANRDFLVDFVRNRMPHFSVGRPEGTYLAWIDCRDAKLHPDPTTFFLERAQVALSDGRSFGPGGEGFVRVNFGCPRPVLAQALERMASAMQAA